MTGPTRVTSLDISDAGLSGVDLASGTVTLNKIATNAFHGSIIVNNTTDVLNKVLKRGATPYSHLVSSDDFADGIGYTSTVHVTGQVSNLRYINSGASVDVTSDDLILNYTGNSTGVVTLPPTPVYGSTYRVLNSSTGLTGQVRVTGSHPVGLTGYYPLQAGEGLNLYFNGTKWEADTAGAFPDFSTYRRRGVAENRWYSNIVTAVGMNTVLLTSNTVYYMPFPVGNTCILDAMGINVTASGAAGSNARVSMYRDNGNVSPGQLFVDAGSTPTITNSVFTFTVTGGAVMTPGLYWLTIAVTGAPTLRAGTTNAAFNILGFDSTFGTTPAVGWSGVYNYNGQVSPSTAQTGLATRDGATTPAIFVRLR